MIGPRGHDVAVLWSRPSRDAYAAQAVSRGETYRFTDAWGRPRTWLKGEHAYLAPAGASVLLARCNLKHDVVEEADLTEERLARIRALLVPNAQHLGERTIVRIEAWLLREAWRGRTRFALCAGLFCLSVSWLTPWYAAWPVALAAIEEDAAGALLALGLTAYLLWDALPL